MNSGGNRLGATFKATAAAGSGALARVYSTTGNVSTTGKHQIQFDYRFDGSLSTFTSATDAVIVFGDTAARSAVASTNTWLATAMGATSGGITAKVWAFQNGNKAGGAGTLVSTGVSLVQNTVYHFTIRVDPANKSYTATITDGQAGTGHTFTSGTLGFRANSTTTSAVNVGMTLSAVNETNTYSLDSLLITPQPPTVPASFVAIAQSESAITLFWTDSATNETAYKIERSTDQTNWTLIQTTAANATSYPDTGLSHGTRYYYRIWATNEGGDSAKLSSNDVTVLPAPSGLNLTPISSSRIDLAWTDNSTGETGFKIERSPNGSSSWSLVFTTAANATSWSNTGLTEATRYYYRVSATKSSIDSDTTSVVSAWTILPAPSGLTATNTAPHEVTLSWTDNSSGADLFNVERKQGLTGTWESINLVSTTSWADGGVTGGLDYYYRVEAFKGAADSDYSAEKFIHVLLDPPADPSNLTATAISASQIELAWTDNATNESGYKVERSTNQTTWTLLTTTAADATSYSSTSLSEAVHYYYRVRATNEGGDSNNATADTFTRVAAPSDFTATVATSTQVNLAWTDNSGVETGVKIERSTDQSSWTLVTTTAANATSYNDTGLANGTRYFYRVRATNGTLDSSNAPTRTAITTLPAPTGLTATAASGTQINLSWTDNATGELGYKIERSTDQSNWTLLATTTASATTFSDFNAADTTQYFYRVRATTAFTDSTNATANATTPLAAPVNLVATPVSVGRIDLFWTDQGSESEFRIERKLGAGGTWAQIGIAAANATTYADSSVTSGNDYYYQVRAAKGAALSAYAGPAIARATSVNVPFSDNFNRTDSTALGTAWAEASGDFAISGNKLINSIGSDSYAYVAGFSYLNVSVSATVDVTSSGPFAHGGLLLRSTGSSTGTQYLGRLHRNFGSYSAEILVNNGSGWTTIDSRTVSGGVGTLRFESRGSSLSLLLDNVLVATAENTVVGTAGTVGVWANDSGVSFDSFAADALTGASQPAALPFSDDFNRATNGAIGDHWSEQTGDFAINGNKLQSMAGQSVESVALLNGANAQNVSLQANVDLSATGPFSWGGLSTRVSGNNEYLGRIRRNFDSGFAEILKRVNGTWTTLITANLSAISGTVRFDTVASSLSLFFNGTLVASAEDKSVTPAGRLGVHSADSNVSFDTFSASAVAYSASNATLPFSDDFNRSDGSMIGTSWGELNGDFAIVGNKVVSKTVDGSSLALAAINGVSQGDTIAKADVDLTNTGPFGAGGVGLRAANGDAYIARIRRSFSSVDAEIVKVVGGTWSTLTTQGLGFDAFARNVQLQIVGNSLSLFINGVLQGTATDSVIPNAGGVGIYANDVNVAFDNVNADVMTIAPPQNASLPFSDDFGRASNGFIGPYWTEFDGDLSLSNGIITNAVTGTSSARLNGLSTADVVLSANVDLRSGTMFGSTMGLDARIASSNGARYRAQIRRDVGTTYAEILKFNGSTWTTLDSRQIQAQNGSLRLEVVGSSLKLYVNGRPVAKATDSSITAAGAAGFNFYAGSGGFERTLTLDNFSAVAPTSAPSSVNATLPFSDAFNRADSTYISGHWNEQTGEFAVGEHGVYTIFGGESYSSLNGLTAADVSISAAIDMLGSGANTITAGLDARVAGTNAYRGQLRNDHGTYYAELLAKVGGTWSTLDSRVVVWPNVDALPVGMGSGTLRLEVTGNHLGLYVDGRVVASVNNSSVTAGGTVALYSSDSTGFDELSVAVLSVSPQNATLTFSDAFNRADNTTSVGPHWTEQAGDYSIVNHRAVSMSLGDSVATLNGVSAANIVVSANVTAPASQAAGLIARLANASNYYLARINGSGTAEILKRVSGTFTSLASVSIDHTSGKLRFEANGTLLQLFLDDALITSVTDSSISAAGSAGMFAMRAAIDGNSDATIDNFETRVPQSIDHAWLTLPTSAAKSAAYWTPGAAVVDVLVGDFNADGRQDMAGRNSTSGEWLVGTSNGAAGFTTSVWDTWSPSSTWTNLQIGDFNADGKMDLAGRRSSDGAWYVARSNGSSFTSSQWGTFATSTTWADLFVTDVNGDRRADVIGRDTANGNWTAAISSGMALVNKAYGSWGTGVTWSNVQTGDFDGDGRGDVVGRDATSGAWSVGLSSGSKFGKRTWGTWSGSTWQDVTVGDFNGDGKDDLIGRSAAGAHTWQVAVSNGKSFTNQTWNATADNLVNVRVGDFDGDGKDDLIGQVSGTREWRAGLSTGSGFGDQTWVTFSSGLNVDGSVAGDFFNLKREAANAFESVYNTVKFSPYSGLMKGASGAEQSGIANDWDQDALLASKLNALGVQTRYATGQVELSAADAFKWLGVKDGASAEALVDAGGLAATRVNPGASNETIRFNHTWVEAYLPGATGLAWRAMDPSIKFTNLQPGVANLSTSSPFNESGFFAHVTPELALDYYSDQVAAYLAANQPGKSLANVAYDGPIIAKDFAEIPAQLPFSIVGSATTYTSVPDTSKHRVTLHFDENFFFLPDHFFDMTFATADIAGKSLMITYRPGVATNSWIPELRLDGQVIWNTTTEYTDTGPGTSGFPGRLMRLKIDHLDPGDNTVDRTSMYDRLPGEELSIGLDAGQFGENSLSGLRGELVSDSIALKNATGSSTREVFDDGLAVASATYIKQYQERMHTLAGLSSLVYLQPNVGDLLVSGKQSSILTNWDLETPVISPDVNFDIVGSTGTFYATSNAQDLSNERLAATRIAQIDGSGMESQVLEAQYSAKGISGTKGIQWANDHGIPVFVIDSGNASTLIPQLNVLQSTRDLVTGYVGQGMTVKIPRDTLVMDLWSGSAFRVEKTTGGSMVFGDLVTGDYNTHGGRLTGWDWLDDKLSQFFNWTMGDPVNVANGSVYSDYTDVAIANTGFPLAIQRHYDSSGTADVGVGEGWSHNYSDRVSVDGLTGKVTWINGQGQSYVFTPSGSGGFTNPVGLFGQLSTVSGGGFKYRDKNGDERAFNSAGRLISMRDRNGNGLDFSYNGSGQLAAVADAMVSTRKLDFTYASGHVSYVTDFTGRAWHYEYQTLVDPVSSTTKYYLNQVTSPSDAQTAARVMQYGYHTTGVLFGLLHTITDPVDASTITFDYYANRRAFSVTDPDGEREFFEYDHPHSFTRHIDANGNSTIYEQDANGQTNKVIYADNTREVTGLTNTLPTSKIDRDGRTQTFEYDTKGNLTRHVSTDDIETIVTYDSTYSLPLTITRPGGRVTTFQRDTHGNPTSIEDALGNVTTMGYDTRGRMTSLTAPKGNVASPDGNYITTFTYNDAGQVLTTSNALPSTTTNTYDSHGFLLTSTDGEGRTTTYTYDLLGEMLTQMLPDPDGAGSLTAPVSSYAYVGGTLASSTDARGNTWTFSHDRSGRITSVLNPDGTTASTDYDALGNVVALHDGDGRTMSFVYDVANRRIEKIAANSATELFTYDGNGQLVRSVDPRGMTTTITYDAGGRTLTVLDPAGQLSSFTYNTVGDRATATDVRGTTTFTTDLLGRVSQVRGPEGYVATTDYDRNGQVINQTRYHVTGLGTIPSDPRTLSASLKRTTQYAYDIAGRLTQVTDADNHTSSTTYDDAGLVLTTTDERSHTTTRAYDGMGRLSSITEPDPDGAGALAAPVTSFTYDATGNRASMTDANNHATTYSYDVFNRATTITSAKGDSAVNTFDPAGQLVGAQDELGRVRFYSYDVNGRLVRDQMPDPDGNGSKDAPVLTYTYDAAGNVLTSADALGAVTTYEYDALNRVTKTTLPDPDGAGSKTSPVTTAAYNQNNLVSVTDALNHTTTYTYDGQGRRLTETLPDPDGGGSLSAPTTTFSYDALGQLSSITDALSRTTSYTYDKLGRRTSVTEPDPDGAGALTAPVSQYAYDAVGNVTSETDALSQVTSFTYDNLDRQITKTLADPDGAGSLTAPVTTMSYDAVGNLLSLKDPSNNTTSYKYDELNRVVTETNERSESRSYTYDAVGNTLTMTDRNGRVREFSHDGLNRRIEERWMSGASVVRTITYDFDANGRLLSASDPDSSYTYTYDALGRATSISNVGTTGVPTVVLNQNFDAAGRRAEVSAIVNGTADFTNVYSYDAIDRLISVTQAGVSGGASVAAKMVDFTYNAAGQYATIERFSDLAGTNSVAKTTYGYDSIGRLTSLTHADGATTLAGYTWAFDSVGRITGTTSPDGSVSYTYDNDGQLTGADHASQTDEAYSYDGNGNRTNSGYATASDNRLTSDGTYTYEYDGEGNRTKRTNIASGAYDEYAWDYRNRLTSVTSKNAAGTITSKVEYAYDVFDRRIAKKVDTNGDGTTDSTERYVYDGNDVALVYNGSGTLVDRYLQGPDIDHTLAQETSSGAVSWLLTDHEGNVRDIVDNTSTVIDHVKFDSFGNVVSHSNATYAVRYAFAGRELDAETGLYFNRARFFDPKVGRFISQDPLSFRSGDDNLYRYANNDPLGFTDPFGMNAKSERFKQITDHIGWTILAITFAPIILSYAPILGLMALGFGIGWNFESNLLKGQSWDDAAFNTAAQMTGMKQFAEMYYGVDGFGRTLNPLERLDLAIDGGANLAGVLMMSWGATRGLRNIGDVDPGPMTFQAKKLFKDLMLDEVGSDSMFTGGRVPRPTASRPFTNTSLPNRVTRELSPGEIRSPEEVAQARNYFERNRGAAVKWYEERTGLEWPENATHAEHPRAIKDGGDPLFVEPGFDGPNTPHQIPRPENGGLTDAERWGRMGGRPKKQ